MDVQFDIIIVGGGPAGLTAAIYASRAGLKVGLLEKEAPGGKMVKTGLICNYPGVDEIMGFDLSMQMFEHATKYGAEYLYGVVSEIKLEGDVRVVKTMDNQSFRALALIVATGTVERTLGFKEDDELLGRGLSYCAVCDGAFYKGKHVIVIGGGNAALEESLYLTQFVDKVTLVIRRDVFRGDLVSQKQVINHPKIEIIRKHLPHHYLITQDNKLGGVGFTNVETQEILEVHADGLFPYIGAVPATEFLKEFDVLNEEGYVLVDNRMQTKIPGIYAAGDVIAKSLRQIVTAAGDGSVSAQEAFYYIQTLKSKKP